MILALDLGRIHVGIAVSAGSDIAFSRKEIMRPDLVTLLKKIKKEEGIEKIIIGLPLAFSGGDTNQTRIVRNEAKEIEEKIGVKVELLDERLTTLQAKKSGAKENHSEAARLILESYLEKLKNKN